MTKQKGSTNRKLNKIYSLIKKTDSSDRPIYIPISGGTDSALTFYLYNQVYPKRTLGIYFGDRLPFEKWFTQIGKVIKETRWNTYDKEIARWSKLLEKSIKDGAIIIGTRNRTEHLLGTFSHASRLSFHLPIISLFKNEVLQICEEIGCPNEMIEESRKPDASCGRYAEYTKIGIEKIDEYVKMIHDNKVKKEVLKSKDFKYIKDLYNKNSYKKNLPIKF